MPAAEALLDSNGQDYDGVKVVNPFLQ